MRRHVDTEVLNFRSEPVVAEATRIGRLLLGHPVEVLEEGPGRWRRVRTELDGAAREGFVSGRFLRPPVSAPREALIAAAVGEWRRFEMGLGRETDDPFFRFVGEMWASIGLDLDGRDDDIPWSAAAISFMVRQAGPGYARFRFAPAHARFIHDSIRRREAEDTDTPFWGFRLHERRPELGDLVCRGRTDGVSYDLARAQEFFKSHTDIVVKVADGKVLAIGGNVGNSVAITSYRLNPLGFLLETNRVFALLGNRL